MREIRHRKLRIKLEKQKKVGILPEDLNRKDVDICFSYSDKIADLDIEENVMD